MNKFVDPWSDCPSCHQEYQTSLRLISPPRATSKQVFGPDHNVTKDVESLLESINAIHSIDLLTKLLAISKQVRGPDHKTTEESDVVSGN